MEDDIQLKIGEINSRFTYSDLELEAEEEVGVDYTGKIFTKEDIMTPFQVTVEVTVKNESDRDGVEVVQVYVSCMQASEECPVMKPKGSQEVYLKANEAKTVKVFLFYDSFGFYNEEKACFEAGAGEYEILVGSSCGEIWESAVIELEKGYYYT